MPSRVYYTQVIVIPTARGNVTLPTSHVVWVTKGEDVYKVEEFVPLSALGKPTSDVVPVKDQPIQPKALFADNTLDTSIQSVEVDVDFPVEEIPSADNELFLALPDISV